MCCFSDSSSVQFASPFRIAIKCPQRNLCVSRDGHLGLTAKPCQTASERGWLTASIGRITRCVHSGNQRSEEHTSELQSLMRISYAVFCLKKKKHKNNQLRQCMNTRTQ